MISVIKIPNVRMWLESKAKGTFVAWCFRCNKKRISIRDRVEKKDNSRAGYTQQIGKCLTCHGKTSTFLQS